LGWARVFFKAHSYKFPKALKNGLIITRFYIFHLHAILIEENTMYQIMKITIYLLIALMLMGITKCEDLPAPYVPDPLCKQNLEESVQHLTHAFDALNHLNGTNRDRTKTERHTRTEGTSRLTYERNDLEKALDEMKNLKEKVSIPKRRNKIKRERIATIDKLLQTLATERPKVQNYYDKMKSGHSDARMSLNYGDSNKGGGTGTTFVNNAFDQIKHIPSLLRSHMSPLRALTDDGCVARS
jgi:hypothetical protein